LVKKYWEPQTYRSRRRREQFWRAVMFLGALLLLAALTVFLALQ
jgi:hypothetical protein